MPFGRRQSINTSLGPVDIWPHSDSYRIVQNPTTIAISSNSDSDSANGSGCRLIEIVGLPNWYAPPVTETVQMSGTSSVYLKNSLVAINLMTCIEFGVAALNSGQITATSVSNRQPLAIIPKSAGQTQSAIHAVPQGMQYRITSIAVGASNSTASASADIDIRRSTDPRSSTGWITELSASIGSRHLDTQLVIDGPSVVKAVCRWSTVSDIWVDLRGFMIDATSRTPSP